MKDFRQQVLQYAQKAYSDKLIAGTSGNMSIYNRKSGEIFITPTSMGYAEMKADDIVVIDVDGNVLEGNRKPSSEWRMHCEIYKGIDRINAIVHTHSPYATSFSVVRKEIPTILIEMIPFLKGSVEVADYAPQGTAAVGLNCLPILSEKNSCILANHGVVAVGESMASAYINSVYVEDAARIYHMALSIGDVYTI